MKKLIFIIALLLAESGMACNNSSFTLDSMSTSPGPVYNIYARLCIGYGKTGTTLGANDNTNRFAISMWSSNPGFMAGVSFFTPNITGPNPPNVTKAGALIGPTYGLGESCSVRYGTLFGGNIACITSTASCGGVGSWCVQFHITCTILPDSMRAIGIEGLAPLGGCYGLSDMVIAFTTLAGVDEPAHDNMTFTEAFYSVDGLYIGDNREWIADGMYIVIRQYSDGTFERKLKIVRK